MKTTIVTSFSERGYHEYGFRFLEGFSHHVPGEIDLIVYAEHRFPVPDRVTVRPLFGIDLAADFIDQFKDDPLACGREPTPVWKQRDRDAGYSFRTDAVKFCRKVFAISDAAQRMLDGRPPHLLVWMDADVITYQSVPADLFSDLLGDADAAYLGRDGAHSECGFLAFRLPIALPLIMSWEHFYKSGNFLRAREWHDSYLFDLAREEVPGLRYRNLTPGGHGHVWFQSPLGQYFDHLKGKRKASGISAERMAKR